MKVDRDVKTALKVFRETAARREASHLNAVDVSPQATLGNMIDPKCWLPFIMMRSDEFSQILTGKYLWNAVFVGDSDSLYGISVSDKSDFDEETLEGSGMIEKEVGDIPDGVIAIICDYALRKSIEMDKDKGECRIEKLPPQYFMHGSIKDKEVLPEIPGFVHFVNHMNKSIINHSSNIDFILNNYNKNLDI